MRAQVALGAALLAGATLAACSSTPSAGHRSAGHRSAGLRSASRIAASAVAATRAGHPVVYALAADRWTTVPLPHPPAGDGSVAGHGADIYAADVDAGGVALEYSRDGGRSWQSRPVAHTRDLAGVGVALSGDGARLAITLERPASAGAVGQASILVGPAAGGAFTSRAAPAAGQVAWWRGRLVLSGGVLSSRLYLSNASASAWTPVPVGGPLAPVRNVDPATPSVGAAQALPDGSLLVPVTRHAGTPSVDLLATSDGSAFHSLGQVTLSGQLGAGTIAPVGLLPGGGIVVSDPNTIRLHVVRGSSQRTFTPSGLPAPPSTLTFATPALGLAQVDQAHCAQGKTGCTVRTDVFATSDGGRTWRLAP